MMDRRAFLKATVGTAASAVLVRPGWSNLGTSPSDYGPLTSLPDRIRKEELLALPRDFGYNALMADGDKLRDGLLTPDRPRQIGCFRLNGQTYAIRNHLGHGATSIGNANLSFDPASPGGSVCFILENNTNELLRDWCVLSGIEQPRFGTTTAWGTWIALDKRGNLFEANPRQRQLAKPEAVRIFGELPVGAIAYDSLNQALVATAGNELVRWLLASTPDLKAGGTLEMLSADPWNTVRESVFNWTAESAGVPSKRKIVALACRGAEIYVLTSTERLSESDLWLLRSLGGARVSVKRLRRLQTVSPESVEQMTLSPTGGVILASGQRLVAVPFNQAPFDLARTLKAGQRFMGVAFSVDGRSLLATLDRPGITVVIAGPWETGPL